MKRGRGRTRRRAARNAGYTRKGLMKEHGIGLRAATKMQTVIGGNIRRTNRQTGATPGTGHGAHTSAGVEHGYKRAAKKGLITKKQARQAARHTANPKSKVAYGYGQSIYRSARSGGAGHARAGAKAALSVLGVRDRQRRR